MEPAGLGSGAACTNQALLQAIRTGDRTLPGQVIDSVYVAAGYKLPEAQREKYIDSILLCKTGDDMCQGDSIPCAQWPYAKSGGKGVLERYRAVGGRYEEQLISGSGHGCMLDHEDRVVALLQQFIL